MDAAEGLVLAHGFNATRVDAIIAAADASKGAFFHHFPSKEALGQALVDRYAARDADMLELFMKTAEKRSDDPAEQVVSFVEQFAGLADEITSQMPGCLFVSFVYERGPTGVNEDDVIAESVVLWRNKILEKLELAAETRPALAAMDLPALADLVFSTFEGAFVLVRATNDRSHLRRQLLLLQNHYEMLLGVEAPHPM